MESLLLTADDNKETRQPDRDSANSHPSTTTTTTTTTTTANEAKQSKGTQSYGRKTSNEEGQREQQRDRESSRGAMKSWKLLQASQQCQLANE